MNDYRVEGLRGRVEMTCHHCGISLVVAGGLERDCVVCVV